MADKEMGVAPPEKAHLDLKVPNELLTRQKRKAAGKALRDKCPRNVHVTWKAPKDRPDPVELLIQSSKDRMPPTYPDPLRADDAIAVHVFSRRGCDHGGRSGLHAGVGNSSAGLR